MYRPAIRLRSPKAFASLATKSIAATKAAGDISSVFPSLSGIGVPPLPQRFADIQGTLILGKEQLIVDAWTRLLASLEAEIQEIKARGSEIIPSVDFERDIDVNPATGDATFKDIGLIAEIRKRGAAVIRNVVPKDIARVYKYEADKYIKANPSVAAFPKDSPSVYELYWSPSQLRARSHPNLLLAQKALMSLWQSSQSKVQLSIRHPLIYADRLRIRLPGDAQFTLGPHIDGGSIERWEDSEYVKVYQNILGGRWETYDAFDYAHRVDAVTDMYGAGGACSMFRMFQGWLAMSNAGPNEGTLRVYPLLKQATAYTMLRPFFDAQTGMKFTAPSPSFPNTALGAAQELSPATHPHLQLEHAMTPIPKVQPGDYVAWHCDTIHSVDPRHNGSSDSSVLYIPAIPMTIPNLQYLVRQRAAFKKLSPPPDFPDAGGSGERGFVGHGTEADFASAEGLRAAGCGSLGWDISNVSSSSERQLLDRANMTVF
ncbi:hypothetical protein V1525DRAFT_399694 [Lipomyces kononenkoae]|uniref:Uncharacterized protein n=1 Tax=Lipomyces kononenkoae TaxID=34357 RepID=A0ACC3T4J4_LIPKO